MKNIVILANGTWNDKGKDDQEKALLTNVVWLEELCVHDPKRQVVWYTDGVGTSGLVDKFTGGVFGFGLTRDICAAYRAVSERYEEDDRIIFAGFSRGAYTVRTAADMIAEIGLADLSSIPGNQRDGYCRDLFAVYRKKKKITDINTVPFFNATSPEFAKGTTKIHLICVWDTVGTAGIPDHYKILNSFDRISQKHNWANTHLSPAVQNARHAIGMDEMRETFVPAFWTNDDDTIANDDRIKQLWFSGVHTDIGGGYEKRDLGNITMAWMTEEASKLGLLLKENPKRPIPKERAMGSVNNSLQSVFRYMWTRPRGVPNVFDPANKDLFHPSVLRRYKHKEVSSTPDWTAEKLVKGRPVKRVAWAQDRWTMLKVYLEADKTYEIFADGIWKDSSRKFNADGVWLNKPDKILASVFDVHKVVDALSWFAVKNRDKDEHRRVFGAWRVPTSKPFKLIGVVADGVGVTNYDDGSNGGVIMPERHTTFDIGSHVLIGPNEDVSLKRGGYLYCFPNDVWSKYANNTGCLEIEIVSKD